MTREDKNDSAHDANLCPRCGHAAGDHHVEGFFPGGTHVGIGCVGCAWSGLKPTPLDGRCRWDTNGPLTLTGRHRKVTT